MADPFKILILGGQRTGKTTLLASLVDQMLHGHISNILTIKDKNPKATKLLESKISGLKWLLTAYQGCTILVNDEKTNNLDDYTIELKIPGSKEVMRIIFSVASDEFYESGTLGRYKMEKKIRSYDAYIIVIDTPYLMEAANSKNKLCTENVNEGVNYVNAICTLLNMINDNKGPNAHQQVIFVPMKCEYWAKRGELEAIYRRVLAVYHTAMAGLSRNRNVEVDVIPIQIIGGLEFQEQRKSYLLYGSTKAPQRCAIIEEESKIRLEDGVVFAFREMEMIHDDPTAIISKENPQFRPLSWFNVTGHYKSRNCEQVMLYILRFLVLKLLSVKISEVDNNKLSEWEAQTCVIMSGVNPSMSLGYLGSKYFIVKEGLTSLKHLENLLDTLTDGRLIKENSEGIHIVKHSELSNI